MAKADSAAAGQHHGRGAAVILAAGQGTRMRSRLPKVLHPLAELPLCAHVIRLAAGRGLAPVVVVVSPVNAAAIEARVRPLFADLDLRFAVQAAPRGTGDAARAGLDALPEHTGPVTLLYGDVPLLQPATLERLAAAAAGVPLALVSARVAEPHGYGRILRAGDGKVTGIVEQRDASAEQAAIAEINAGVYLGDAALLRAALAALTPDNAQGELYLTDVVAYAAAHGGCHAAVVDDVDDIRGVNSRAELAAAEAILRRRLVAAHQARGVTFRDPSQVALGVDVALEEDVEIGIGVQLFGATRIGRGACIEGPSVLRDVEVAEGAQIAGFSHLERARVGPACHVGPFARLRPEATLGARARVGNFVEIKKSTLGEGAKVNHLAYVGDAAIGAGANLGAGTITCNYDGVNKHRTEVGENAFVGSNSTLVAPLTIGPGAFVAAGSALTQSVPADALAFGRAQQVNREGYAKALRARLAAARAGPKKPVKA